LAAALLDAGVAPRGRDASDLLFAACADEPLRVPSVNSKIPTAIGATPATAMRATMAALLSRHAIRDEVLSGGGERVSGMLSRRGLWDRALLLASGDRSGSRASRTQARGTLLAVAAEHGAPAPLAALLAALERQALLRLGRAADRSAARRNAARDACGLARTLCTHLLPLLTRPPVVAGAAPPRGERPHCVALVGATARRLRAAAGGVVVEPLALLADLPESDDDSSDDDSESDSESDGEEGPMGSPHPAALADILPALFPLPAASHDAACAAVAASLAEGAPLAWSPATHSACPPAFRAAMRAAACSLRAMGLPPELLEAVVCRAAEAQLWPGSTRSWMLGASMPLASTRCRPRHSPSWSAAERRDKHAHYALRY
jgi:hypothetical protein